MAEQAALQDSVTSSAKAGKYLTFALAEEEYGLEILKVREIIQMMEITAVPKTPPQVKGVINLRGKVIPVVDLRLKVGLPEAERTDQTCIIVVDIGDVETGVIVDHVSEVLNIQSEDIEDVPSFGVAVDTDFILGMDKAEDRVIMLVDISKLLSSKDVATIQQIDELAKPDSSVQSDADAPTKAKDEETPRDTAEETPAEQA